MFCLNAGESGLFYMAETTDLERQRCELDSSCVTISRQSVENLLEHSFVFADQPPLGAPFLAVAENVEPRAAQAAQLREDAKCVEHPRAVGALAQMSALGIAIGE